MATTTPPRNPIRLPDHVPPVRQRRRERLRGAVAAVFLLVLVVGVPIGLVLGVGFPDGLSLPDRSWITAQIDTTTVLQIFSLVVWLAWLHFVICLVAEWRSERSGAALPTRVPLGGGSQLVARRLVASLLLITGTATLLGHSTTAPGQVQPRPAATAPLRVGTPAPQAQGSPVSQDPLAPHAAAPRTTAVHHGAAAAVPAHLSHAPAAHAKKYYEVQAHQGRHYDTLWGIAERFLGNGLRYKEIFALNKDRMQPDGVALTKPDLIRPGWVLRLPDDAAGSGLRVVAPVPVHRAVPARHAQPAHQPVAHRAAVHQPAVHLPKPAHQSVTEHSASVEAAITAPVVAPVVAAPPVVRVVTAPAVTTPAADTSDGAGLPRDLLGGSLVAAGLLLALRRRRGAFGPAGSDVSEAEGALRLAADIPAARFLDRATRQLSADLTAAGRSLPEIYAALLDDDALTLCLASAEQGQAPSPWLASEDNTSWSVEAASLGGTAAASSTPAPFPGLCVFGVLGRRRVLLDLEAAPGMVSIGGDGRVARDLAASVAVELGTNIWSDDVRVTLVGFGDDLAALAPHRMRHSTSLDEALTGLEQRLAGLGELREAPDAVLRGRRQRSSAAAWRPEILVLSGPPSAEDARRVAALLGDQRLPAAVLTVGDVAQARWRFVARPDGTLDTGVLGIEIEAAALPADHYRPLVGQLTEARDESAVPGAVMAGLRRSPNDDPDGPAGPAGPGGIVLPIAVELPAEVLRLDRRMPVEVRVLGPVTVAAPGALDPDRATLSTEIVTFVALHPHGVHPNVLRAAIWPRGAEDDVVDAAIGHVQAWLGRSSDGSERLRLVDGRWSFSPEVRIDWPVFRALIRRGAVSLDVEGSLVQALSLVTGPFGEGLPAGRYAWLAGTGAEQAIRAAVVAAAHEACELALGRGDAAAALSRARAGLLMLPTSELLWRDALRAAAATGDQVQLQALARHLASALGGVVLREVSASQTDALLDELLPGSTRAVA